MNTLNTNDSRRGRRVERLSDKFLGKYIKQTPDQIWAERVLGKTIADLWLLTW